MLTVTDLHAGYGSVPVLHGVSLTVAEGEIVAIVGPNGAGKSTLMKTLFALLPAAQGKIVFDGRDLTAVRTARLADLGMGYVPQGSNTFPDLNVDDNLRVAASAMPRGGADEALRAVYDEFPALEGLKRRRAGLLSGGERQMLALASAIVQRPTFLALDEPTTGLAPSIVTNLVQDILALSRAGVTVLWVIEENPREIIEHVDRVLLLQNGLIAQEREPAELLEGSALEDIFFHAEA